MHELNELLQWCISNKAWLTFNFYNGQYKVFVNPGRTMTEAKWYPSIDDAVKACWKAVGVNRKDVISEHPKERWIYAEVDGVDMIVELPKEQPKRRGRPKGSKNRPKAVAE